MTREWAKLSASAIADEGLSAAQYRVLGMLGLSANKDGECWLAQRTIAEKLGLTERHVRRSLLDLAARGHVEIAKRGKGRVYTLPHRTHRAGVTPDTQSRCNARTPDILSPNTGHTEPVVSTIGTRERTRGGNGSKLNSNADLEAVFSKHGQKLEDWARGCRRGNDHLDLMDLFAKPLSSIDTALGKFVDCKFKPTTFPRRVAWLLTSISDGSEGNTETVTEAEALRVLAEYDEKIEAAATQDDRWRLLAERERYSQGVTVCQ